MPSIRDLRFVSFLEEDPQYLLFYADARNAETLGDLTQAQEVLLSQ